MNQAYQLAEQDLCVFPVLVSPSKDRAGKHDKKPLVEWRAYSSCEHGSIELMPWDRATHVGIDCGKSRICVVDVDNMDALDTLNLPITRVQETISGGRHYLYKRPELFEQRNTTNAPAPGIDIRGGGGFIVWYGKGALVDEQIEPWPWKKAISPKVADTPLRVDDDWSQVVHEGGRNNALFRYLGEFRSRGLEFPELLALANNFNLPSCSPMLPAEEVIEAVNSIMRYEPAEADAAPDKREEAGEPDVLDGVDMARDAKAPVYLINQILESEAMGILGGASMTYKSFLALRMAYSIATGCPFFGHETFKQGSVLYVCGEGKGGVSRRWRALTKKYGDAPKGSFMLYNRSTAFKSGICMQRLADTIDRLKPSLVIFDTFASLSGGVEENSTTEVALALANIRKVCGDASVLVVHHYGKNAALGLRGASNFLNDVDFAYECVRPELIPVATFTCLKTKDGEFFHPMDFTGSSVPLGLYDQTGKEVYSLVAVFSDRQYYIPDKNYSQIRG